MRHVWIVVVTDARCSEDAACLVGQGGAEGIQNLSRRRPVHLPRSPDDRSGGRQGRSRKNHCRASALVFLKSRYRISGDAFRIIYAVQWAHEIWVVHAFQKKSTIGTKTPRQEIEVIKTRLKRLKEMLT